MRTPETPGADARVRLDKWLWAARFFKTRQLAAEAIELGRVRLDGHALKPGREVKVGDRLVIRRGDETFELRVQALSMLRGPAPVAQRLYEESALSIAARQAERERRRAQGAEPARHIVGGRPTKRERRQLDDVREAPPWDERWSARIGPR